jgi:hypothetical protein
MKRRRLTPYTARGIRRVRCACQGCRRRGYTQWKTCADRGEYRAVCWVHDIELNFMVLELLGDPHAKAKHAAYSARVIREINQGPVRGA